MERHRLGIDLVDQLLRELTRRTRFGQLKWEQAPRRTEQAALGSVIVPRQGQWVRTLARTNYSPLYSIEICAPQRSAYMEVWLCGDDTGSPDKASKDACLGSARFSREEQYVYSRISLLYNLASGDLRIGDSPTRQMYRELLNIQYDVHTEG